MTSAPKYYHHGRSPAAWAGSITAAVGFIIVTIAAMLGPNWTLVIIGGAIVLIAALATLIMKIMGFGQP